MTQTSAGNIAAGPVLNPGTAQEVDPVTPLRLGSYSIESSLGRGGMGEVFLAWDERLHRHVAIKRIRADLDTDEHHRARFRREARAAARLSHPAIVQIHDILQLEDAGDCIVMEYVEGSSLSQHIESGERRVQWVLQVAEDIASGLAEAHGKGLVHRDLKPENVMITGSGRAKILDFGLARMLWSGDGPASLVTQAGTLVGTAHAMSPEQATGRPVDHRSDLFALGGLLYEMLTGRAPFRGDNLLDTLRKVTAETPGPLTLLRPDLSPDDASWVMELLAKDPDQRPANASLVVGRLARWRRESAASFPSSAADPGAAEDQGPAVDSADGDLPTGEWRQSQIASTAGSSSFEPQALEQEAREEDVVRTLFAVRWGDTEDEPAGGGSRALNLGIHHDRRLRELVARHGGREVEKAEGFLGLFERPVDALACALAYRRLLSAMSNSGLGTAGAKPEARLAVHLGELRLRHNPEVDVRRGARPLEVSGDARRRVTQLARLALPGQVLLTRGAFDLARRAGTGEEETRGLRWLAHGPFAVAGESEPVEIFEAGLVGLAPLTAPQGRDWVRRVLSPSEERMLGWRPAADQPIPRRPHWRLQRRIGEGGFGEVWLASHKAGDQRVFKFCFEADRLRALKREVTLFRLLKEALGHRDDIARILDWNFDEAPYFVESEYTEGGNLVQWSDSQGGVSRVPLETRLTLAAEVADALAAAHSVGVLHKDVKPENVLVTWDREGKPRARLTDFGIGLLTEKDRLDSPGFTAMGFTQATLDGEASGTGTLGYLAPELLAGRAATIQADIYSLGVLAYQLAVGDFERRLAPGWERDVVDELLAEDLAGWVDGLPERRPASAGQVADALRTLDDRRRRRWEEAARQAALERQQKLRKRATTVAVVALMVLVVVAWMALRENKARQLANQEAERANREAETSQRVTEVMVGMFRMSDPNEAKGSSVTAREILDRGLERIETELGDQPEIRATLMNTMAEVYHGLGLFSVAERLAQDTLDIRDGLLPDDDPRIADSLAILGETRLRRGDYERGESYLRRAIEIRRQEPDRDLEVADHLHTLGRWLNHRDTVTAEGFLRQALEIRRQRLGEDDGATLETRRHLLTALLYQGRIEEAERQMTEFLGRWRRRYPEPSPELANILKTLAQTRWLLGKNEEGEEVAREALEIDLKVHGDQHSNTLLAYSILGGIEQALNRPNEAEALFRHAVESYERQGLKTHYAAKGFNGLGWLLLETEGCGAAEPWAKKALSLMRHELRVPEPAPQVALAEGLLGICRFRDGRMEEAEALLGSSFPVLRDKQTMRAPRTLRVLDTLILLYENQGAADRAAEYRRQRPIT